MYIHVLSLPTLVLLLLVSGVGLKFEGCEYQGPGGWCSFGAGYVYRLVCLVENKLNEQTTQYSTSNIAAQLKTKQQGVDLL